MASATSALATLAPYQPPEGLSAKEILAHARDHIGKLVKKNATLEDKHTETKGYFRTKGVAGLTTAATLVTASTLGIVNGRFGGDADHLNFHGMPLDVAWGIVGHAVGYTNVLGGIGSELVHATGDAAWGSSAYRWSFAKGQELAARAKAAKAGAGAGAGAAPQNGAGAGPRGGTTYSVPQK
jgi:hypothetical protein